MTQIVPTANEADLLWKEWRLGRINDLKLRYGLSTALKIVDSELVVLRGSPVIELTKPKSNRRRYRRSPRR